MLLANPRDRGALSLRAARARSEREHPARRPAGRWCGIRAKQQTESASRPKPSKLKQGQPNKTKQKCLDLLGFIRPIWAFSMGYPDSKQEIFLRAPLHSRLSSERLVSIRHWRRMACFLIFVKILLNFKLWRSPMQVRFMPVVSSRGGSSAGLSKMVKTGVLASLGVVLHARAQGRGDLMRLSWVRASRSRLPLTQLSICKCTSQIHWTSLKRMRRLDASGGC
jgi:hypothetical protein